MCQGRAVIRGNEGEENIHLVLLGRITLVHCEKILETKYASQQSHQFDGGKQNFCAFVPAV